MHHARPILAVIAASMFAFVAPAWPRRGQSGQAQGARLLEVEEMPFGRAGNPKKANRTIRIGMHDTMRFVASVAPRGDVQPGTPPHTMPADFVVKKGETVRFIVHNDGKVMHEVVIGTLDELKKHAELMRKFPTWSTTSPTWRTSRRARRASLCGSSPRRRVPYASPRSRPWRPGWSPRSL